MGSQTVAKRLKWEVRPLRNVCISYAAHDVCFLHNLYDNMPLQASEEQLLEVLWRSFRRVEKAVRYGMYVCMYV